MEIAIETVFQCQICNKVAGKLKITMVGNQAAELSIKGLIGQRIEVILGDKLDSAWNAISHNDISKLFLMNSDWVSSFCPKCTTNFCREHWLIDFDFGMGDEPSLYIYGTCPAGHKHLVDHCFSQSV